jgi:hypothetical protein
MPRKKASQKMFQVRRPGYKAPVEITIPTKTLSEVGEANLRVIKPTSYKKFYRLVWVSVDGPYSYASEDTKEYHTREGADTAKGYLERLLAANNALGKASQKIEQLEITVLDLQMRLADTQQLHSDAQGQDFGMKEGPYYGEEDTIPTSTD